MKPLKQILEDDYGIYSDTKHHTYDYLYKSILEAGQKYASQFQSEQPPINNNKIRNEILSIISSNTERVEYRKNNRAAKIKASKKQIELSI